MFAQRGIEIESYDDIILMSYVADAGRAGHALESLAERTFNHGAIDINELIKAGKAKITFDAVGIDRATEYSAERADIIFRVWQVLSPRLAAETVRNVYETLERPLLSVLGRMERRGISVDRNVLSRLSGEFAQEAAGLEAEINTACRRDRQCRQPEADRRHSVRQAGTARRHQDQDRAMGDRRAAAG